jgi:hypothetical protein
MHSPALPPPLHPYHGALDPPSVFLIPPVLHAWPALLISLPSHLDPLPNLSARTTLLKSDLDSVRRSLT